MMTEMVTLSGEVTVIVVFPITVITGAAVWKKGMHRTELQHAFSTVLY